MNPGTENTNDAKRKRAIRVAPFHSHFTPERMAELTKQSGAVPCIGVRLDTAEALAILLSKAATTIQLLSEHVNNAHRAGGFNNYSMDAVASYSTTVTEGRMVVGDLAAATHDVDSWIAAAMGGIKAQKAEEADPFKLKDGQPEADSAQSGEGNGNVKNL